MRILLVNKLYSPWVGGVEKIVQQIAEGLNKKNDFEIGALCCQPKGKRVEEIIKGVRISRAASLGIFWGMPISFDFFRLFKSLSKKTDIIDFHHPFPLADLAIFLFKSKAKLIVHYHSDIIRQKSLEFLIRPLVLNTLKRAKKIIVSNPNLIKSSPYLRSFQEKCELIPFGVDLSKFEESSEKEIESLKQKYDDFVLFVGRLNYYKGVEYLIEAMRDIKVNLVIIGQGPEKEFLKKQVRLLKIEGKVFFLPFQPREQLINFYKACQVFVLPSIFKSEAFGIVLIEAMAQGAPVISTELGTGTSWVNIDGQTGFVVPAKNAKALNSAVKKIMKDKKKAKIFSQNAKERAKKEFSLTKMLERTDSIYRAIQ